MNIHHQSGSVLGGTIVLSLILTVGAAGFLALTSAWESQMNGHLERVRMLMSAEAGLQLGARWVRQDKTDAQLDALSTGETPISQSLQNDYVEIENVLVKVTLNALGGGKFELVSRAKLNPCGERLELRWGFDPGPGTGGLNSNLAFEEWKEDFIACD